METVSKGIFVNGPSKGNKRRQHSAVFDELSNKSWYQCYIRLYDSLKQKLEDLNNDVSTKVINDIVKFISDYKSLRETVPVVTLFTGTNLPDHANLFSAVSSEIKTRLNYPTIVLHPSRSNDVTYLIKNLFWKCKNTVNETPLDESNTDCAKSIEANEIFRDFIELDSPMILIIPDIESFPFDVLRHLLFTLSVYRESVSIVLILGVATTLNAVQDLLGEQCRAKFTPVVFQAQPSVIFLNSVLEKVFLTSDCPFQLGSKVFDYLTELFLFHDFSVETFIRGIRFCLMDHFFESKLNVLCCHFDKISDQVRQLNRKQIEELSRLPSVEQYKLEKNVHDDVLSQKDILQLLENLHRHISSFHLAIRCLHVMTSFLPDAPLGSHIREIYILAMELDLTRDAKFKKCIELLQMASKTILLEKIDEMIKILSSNEKEALNDSKTAEILYQFESHRNIIDKSDLQKKVTLVVQDDCSHDETSNELASNVKTPPRVKTIPRVKMPTTPSRTDFKQSLMMSRSSEKELTEFESAKSQFLTFVSQQFFKHRLRPPTELPLHEIMIYSRINEVKSTFVGAPRATVCCALSNPADFLNCKCCKLTNNQEILESFPDICIAYNLYLECGSIINLYDWLQSFVFKVGSENINSDSIDPKVHSRFLQAVKELQFLGFIVPSSRKQDCVKKITL